MSASGGMEWELPEGEVLTDGYRNYGASHGCLISPQNVYTMFQGGLNGNYGNSRHEGSRAVVLPVFISVPSKQPLLSVMI